MRTRPSPSSTEAASAAGALDQALGALRRRERSAAEVDRYLAERGVGDDARAEVIETLARTALVDDRRFAELRARTLAERGAGNDLVRHELARAGVDAELVDEAVAALPPESERAARIVARKGASPKTARYLGGKGFSDDVVRAVIAHSRDEPLG
jgi:SOS response regulatory protein OraA/RecX